MIRFARIVLEFSGDRMHRFMPLAVLSATALAVLEAGGLVLVVPLIQLLQGEAGLDDLPYGRSVIEQLAWDESNLALAALVGGVVFLLFLTKGVLSVLYLRWSVGAVLDEEAIAASALLDRYLRSPLLRHLQERTGPRQATINDILHRIYADGFIGVIGAIADLLVMLLIGSVLLLIEPVVSMMAITYLGVVAIAYQRGVHGRADRAGRALVADLEYSHAVVHNALSAYKSIVVGHHAAHFSSELLRAKIRASGQHRALMMIFRAPRYYLEIALLIGVGLLALGLYSRSEPTAATASLALFLTAGFRLLPGLNRVLGAVSTSQSLVPAAEQIRSQLSSPTPNPSPKAGHHPMTGPREVQIRDLTFSYPGAPVPVLRGVNMTITPGEFTAIIGSSGVGKSTLLDVILGLLPPSSGRILVEGRPLHEQVEEWQRSLGFVPQSTTILDDTLARNVAFGLEDSVIDRARVSQCLDMVALGPFVHELSDGLDTPLREAGSRLSGGQRQRVGIARALYGDPSTLVLDEITSSLDRETERAIAQTIDRLRGERTVILVTHRLEIADGCDRAHLLEAGRVTWTGKPGDLPLERSESSPIAQTEPS